MRPTAALVLAALLLSACSLPLRTAAPPLAAAAPEMQHIRITSWGTPRFSGLLGLRLQGTDLQYILLDATGITLLESRLTPDGFVVIHAAGDLKDSGLPGFLASTLRKIYLDEPETEPCADSLLLRFCMEKADGGIAAKRVTLGPVTFWEANYSGANPPVITFSEPWFGVSLTLTGLNRPEQP